MTIADFKTILHMARGLRGGDHQERLESFYAPQADGYDDFRERLLHGRRELYTRLPLRAGQRVAELGGGTGRNLEFLDDRIHALERVDLVDLCRPLLDKARERCVARGWEHVCCLHDDVCTWGEAGTYDVVLFSYSLSMIPDWRAALANAERLLRPDGHLALVDFHVSPLVVPPGHVRHGWWSRHFWPWWFRRDGVHLRSELLGTLQERFIEVHRYEATGPVPYTPWRVPHLRFVGRRR